MPSTEAQRAFAEFLERAQRGEGPSFDEVCANHRDIADELRRMYAEWQTETRSDSFFDQLKTQLGENVDPGISLDREPEREVPRDTAALLQKVADMSSAQRYSIKGEVARGGMGMIYKVWDRDLRRTLAMKVVLGKDGDAKEGSSAGLDRDRLGRFLEEAQITGQLDHPGIVPVHELGLDHVGRVYFTMRLVRGKEFREIIEHSRDGKDGWTLVRTIQIVQRICEAMAFAHEKGVVHRDLKPANVMVGRFGEVYVMDWGLAKVVGREDLREQPSADITQSMVVATDGNDQLDTMEGSVFGTPCYMAPEQARGQQDRIGPWSDVYSVGSILYHLLTGRMPYVPLGERMHPHAVLSLLLQGPPTPIQECSVSVSDELVAICGKAMEREPEARYPSMLAMAEDLQAFLEGRVVQAHQTGAVAEFRKWVSRNKGTAASLVGLVLVLVGGAVGFAWQQKALVGTIRAEQEATLLAKLEAEANEQRAMRQSYAANLAAADVSLRTNEITAAKRRLAACPPNVRGWEWSHVSSVADSSVAVLPHDEAVTCVAADPDFFRIATGSSDFVLRLFDPDSLQLVAELPGHSGAIAGVDFDSTGRRIATGSEDGTVRVWDVASRRNLLALRGHEATVASVDFHPENTWIASGGWDHRVRVWDADTGRELVALEAREQPVDVVRFSPDGSLVAAGARDGSVLVWGTDDWSEVLTFRAHSGAVRALDYSSDGTRIATASPEGELGIWDAASGEARVETAGPVSFFCLAFAPGGDQLVVGGLDKSLRLIDTETGESSVVLHGHDEAVRAATFSADGTRILTGSMDATARVWATGISGARSSLVVEAEEPVSAVAAATDGRRVAASALFTGTIRIWDGPSGVVLTEVPGRDEGVTSLAFSPTDDWLAAGLESESTIVLYDTSSGAALGKPLSGHEASVTAIAVSADGTRIGSASADGTVRLWDPMRGVETKRLEGHQAPATSVAFSPDGTLAASGATDGWVRTWEVETGAVALSFQAHQEGVRDVVYDPAGARLVSASLDGDLHVYDCATGARLAVLSGHGGGVYAAAFSPDGQRLVSASFDKTLRLWDAESYEALISLRGHDGPITDVEFDRLGHRIVSGSFDGTVGLWEIAPASQRYRSVRAAAILEQRIALAGNLDEAVDSIRNDNQLDAELISEALAIAELRR